MQESHRQPPAAASRRTGDERASQTTFGKRRLGTPSRSAGSHSCSSAFVASIPVARSRRSRARAAGLQRRRWARAGGAVHGARWDGVRRRRQLVRRRLRRRAPDRCRRHDQHGRWYRALAPRARPQHLVIGPRTRFKGEGGPATEAMLSPMRSQSTPLGACTSQTAPATACTGCPPTARSRPLQARSPARADGSVTAGRRPRRSSTAPLPSSSIDPAIC